MALIELNVTPARKELRLFAGLWFPLFTLIVGGLLYRAGWHRLALALWIFAAALALIGQVRPGVVQPVFIGLMYLVYPIGWVISHVVFGIVYYLVITPIGLVMRVVGYDPLHRKIDRAAKTYWVDYNPDAQTSRYLRQY